MLNLKKKTDQEKESKSLLGDNAECFSKQSEEVLDVETGATSSSTMVSEDEYVLSVLPTREKRQRLTEAETIDLGMHLFVCLTSQVTSFIDEMNQNMVCRTPGCSGTLFQLEQLLKEWVELSK